MYGLEAISASNGWNIAALGISIVFTGLALLSLAISQLHKVLHLWETKDILFRQVKEEWQKRKIVLPPVKRLSKKAPAPDLVVPKSLKKSADQFNMLIRHLGEPFPLPKLLELAVKRGLNHPHSTLNELLQAKLIVPDKLGFFHWNQKIYNCITEPGDSRG